MLTCCRLGASYGRAEVLRGIDLTVKPGQVTVVLGANGAGKTTLLRALSGMIPVSGAIRFAGEDVTRLTAPAMTRRGMAHVPQGRGTFSEFTVHENLLLGAATRRRRRAEVAEDLDRMYATFPPLLERREQTASTLSGGEQQMLAVCRALMSRPRLLLLDEPSLGLAPQVTAKLFETLGGLNRDLGMALLVVEQNAALALEIAHYAVVLETGRIVLEGEADVVARDDGLRAAYLGGGG
ncbi:ABC transporter ATP-binding protein [Streptosporangium sp. NPDC004631]